MVEEPLLSCLVFLYATKDDALDLIHNRGVKADIRTDCATRKLMVVPDKEMSDFQRVFDLSVDEGGLMNCLFAKARVPRVWLEFI